MLTKPPPGTMDDPSHPLSQGCVGHWLFNEGAGSLAYDVSGHGNHGTLKDMLPNVQSSGWGGSKFGGGLSFDGDNDYVDIPNSDSINIYGSGAYLTITAWVKHNASQSGHKAIVRKGQDYGVYTIYINDNKPSFSIYAPTNHTVQSSDALSVGEWYHIVGVYDGANMYIYVNGEEKNSDIETDAIVTYSELLQIGGIKVHGYVFNGAIDEVRIYSRALNAEEIKQLYHDPFCNLMQVPAWQLYSPVVGGLSIPVAMHQYEMLRA